MPRIPRDTRQVPVTDQGPNAPAPIGMYDREFAAQQGFADAARRTGSQQFDVSQKVLGLQIQQEYTDALLDYEENYAQAAQEIEQNPDYGSRADQFNKWHDQYVTGRVGQIGTPRARKDAENWFRQQKTKRGLQIWYEAQRQQVASSKQKLSVHINGYARMASGLEGDARAAIDEQVDEHLKNMIESGALGADEAASWRLQYQQAAAKEAYDAAKEMAVITGGEEVFTIAANKALSVGAVSTADIGVDRIQVREGIALREAEIDITEAYEETLAETGDLAKATIAAQAAIKPYLSNEDIKDNRKLYGILYNARQRVSVDWSAERKYADDNQQQVIQGAWDQTRAIETGANPEQQVDISLIEDTEEMQTLAKAQENIVQGKLKETSEPETYYRLMDRAIGMNDEKGFAEYVRELNRNRYADLKLGGEDYDLLSEIAALPLENNTAWRARDYRSKQIEQLKKAAWGDKRELEKVREFDKQFIAWIKAKSDAGQGAGVGAGFIDAKEMYAEAVRIRTSLMPKPVPGFAYGMGLMGATAPSGKATEGKEPEQAARVRVRGPNGETGTVPAESAKKLPEGWEIINE